MQQQDCAPTGIRLFLTRLRLLVAFPFLLVEAFLFGDGSERRP